MRKEKEKVKIHCVHITSDGTCSGTKPLFQPFVLMRQSTFVLMNEVISQINFLCYSLSHGSGVPTSGSLFNIDIKKEI